MTDRHEGAAEAQENEMAQQELTDVRALTEGEIITARIIQVEDDQVFVDVGWKSDLPIPREELSLIPVASAKDLLQEGQEIRVLVVKADEDEGIKLSKKQADQEARWLELEEALESGAPVDGRVVDKTKGGLVVDVGMRGFIPASQAALDYVADLGGMVGQTLALRVLEVERAERRIVLSRRAILADERAKAQAEAYEKLKEGDKITGRVARLASFGAFVDLGAGVEGLLHVSEIAWERVGNPADRLAVGEELELQILKVDPENNRISLSLRQLHPHPWSGVAERFPEGTVAGGTVVRIAPFGVFVRLAEGIEGLVHVSQLADRRVNKPEDVVRVGQEVQVKVLKVDEAAKRISLSMRALTEEAEQKQVNKFLTAQPQERLTIGDLLKFRDGAIPDFSKVTAPQAAKPAAKAAGKTAGTASAGAKETAAKKTGTKKTETETTPATKKTAAKKTAAEPAPAGAAEEKAKSARTKSTGPAAKKSSSAAKTTTAKKSGTAAKKTTTAAKKTTAKVTGKTAAKKAAE